MERPNSRSSGRREKEKEYNGGGSKSGSAKSSKKATRTTHGYAGNFLNSTYPTTLFNKGYSFYDPFFGVLGPHAFSNPAPPPYSDLLQKPSFPYSSNFAQPMYHNMPGSPYATHSAEPSSLPVYGPWSSPRTVRPAMLSPAWDVWSPENRAFRDSPKGAPTPPTRFSNGYLWIPDEDDFASLPPQVSSELKSPRSSPKPDNRRFSDPGLNISQEDKENEESSNTDCGEDDEEGESAAALAMQGGLVQRLLMEMGALRAANQNLQRELNETKIQLETVKARQNSSWRNLGPDYHPGMFADMIREVRDASRLRDEAMMSRLRMASNGFQDFSDVRHYLETQSHRSNERPRREAPPSMRPQAAPRRRNLRTSRGSVHGSRAESSIDEDESSLSGDLLSGNAETASCSSPAGNSNVAGVLAEQVSQLQKEKQQLNDELKQARDSRVETEAHVQKSLSTAL
ncbi:uncharacterized protein LOC132199423 isoform X2 [Neocloeon triangulifer]|uniref:uncharacterized protein LOC132199423 isoform X2 n=1 Tax=Neocloeon triangulifer TaxID=2078957 RepID=UPI00286F9E74|nr:uncharacterized protein LOC132199423 isoform X2 [Neocloeon triangulifer]